MIGLSIVNLALIFFAVSLKIRIYALQDMLLKCDEAATTRERNLWTGPVTDMVLSMCKDINNVKVEHTREYYRSVDRFRVSFEVARIPEGLK